MPPVSLAEDLALSTIGGLNSEDTAALDLAIAGEEVWSHGVAQGATSHDCSSPRGPDRSRARGSLPGRWGIPAPAAECLARGN